MASQIDDLNATVARLKQSVTDLQARVAAIQPPDLSPAIDDIRQVIDGINATAQPPAQAAQG